MDFSRSLFVRQAIEQNRTVYVHMQLSADNPLHKKKPESPRMEQILDLFPRVVDFVPEVLRYNQSLPLIEYHQKSQTKASNLMSDYDMPKEKAAEGDEEKDETYYPHLKREINFHVVCDHSIYKDMRQLNPLVARWFTFDPVVGLFDPILYVSDFWHL